MKYLIDFLRQKAPKSGVDMPDYYRRALIVSETAMALYFVAKALLIYWATGRFDVTPLIMLAVVVGCLLCVKQLGMRGNLLAFALLTFIWCGWYIYAIGWSCGVQHFLLLVLMLAFFNVCEPPLAKVAYLLVLLICRMALYYYSRSFAPVYTVEGTASIVFQTVNSLTVYVILACLCVLFSTNLQEVERKLRIDNQELHKEAGTDPLTQLPNRRAMLDEMELWCRNSPDQSFSVAIADIDFFKNVNDTYGHNCGDYTLRELAGLFKRTAGTDYSVCRWGGEEFCLFMPGMNLDQAGKAMIDLNVAVSRMPLCFEDKEFSITITIGVEENDFQSHIGEIIERADHKLYMGKNSGRNQVVI